MADIDKALLSVVRLEMFNSEVGITSNMPAGRATGFLYKSELGQPRLITNRHVVCERKDDHYPDFLIAHVRVAEGKLSRITMSKTRALQFDLDQNGTRRWKALPDRRVDIAALDIAEAELGGLFATWLSRDDWLPRGCRFLLGSQVTVPGFPKGAFYDEFSNLPVARNATIATDPRLTFNRKRCFLIDGNLPDGMSGSPVVSLPGSPYEKNNVPVFDDANCYLLGIFSSEWFWGSDPLGLNTVWGADLVEDTAQL